MTIPCIIRGLAVEASVGPFLIEDVIPAPAGAAGELVVEYLGVADAVARRFHCPGHDREDLRQVARLRLVKAARRYRPGLGCGGFVPYAVPTIAGEVKRYLRDQSWAVRPPRGLQELRLRVRAARARLEQELGREPTTGDLARALGVAAEEIGQAQIADAAMVAEMIEPADWVQEDGDRRRGVVVGSMDPGFVRAETRADLARALEGATGEDLELLRLRFVQGLTQEEIGRRLGVSQMQVSRLLARLRRRMAA